MNQGKIIDSGFYPIYIGGNLFHILNNYLQLPHFKKSRFYIIADENSHKYCLPILRDKVEMLAGVRVINIAPGEENKTLESCGIIWRELTRDEADRHSVIINLGGGVICDLGGFAASTYKRGIRFINVPTSLNSQIDGSIGGKVGIDYENLKNQIGVFANPQAVFINPTFLMTLPEQHILSGFAEIIKYGLINDASLWQSITSEPYHPEREWYDLIVRSVEIKTSIVRIDPLERKYRKVLNFGHTIGHALESASLDPGFITLSHGMSVAVGMICESYISTKKTGLSKDSCRRITGYIIENFGKIEEFDALIENAMSLMLHDKKNEQGKIMMTLLQGVGNAVINREVDEDLIAESLNYYKNFSG